MFHRVCSHLAQVAKVPTVKMLHLERHGSERLAAALLAVMAGERLLIDWDFGAYGIWTILSTEERNAPAPSGGLWRAADLTELANRPRPYSDILPTDLLDALQDWNDRFGEFDRGGPGNARRPTAAGQRKFREEGAKLAERVQQELGPDYSVLFTTPEGAWRWVVPPWSQA